jgi:quinolinate synthase
METIEQIGQEKTKAIGAACYETQQLAAKLKAVVTAENYDVISYADLSKIIGYDVQRDGYSYLKSAREIVERDTGRLIGVVLSEGVKLLTPEEQVAIGPDSLQRLKRATTKSIKRIGRVQVDKLTDDQRLDYHTSASVLGAVHLFTKPKSVAKIEEAVSKASDKLAIGDTLKLFGK